MGIGSGEILLIAFIALLLFGDKDLPATMRKFVKGFGEVKKITHEVQRSWNDVRDEVSKTIRDEEIRIQEALYQEQTAKLEAEHKAYVAQMEAHHKAQEAQGQVSGGEAPLPSEGVALAAGAGAAHGLSDPLPAATASHIPDHAAHPQPPEPEPAVVPPSPDGTAAARDPMQVALEAARLKANEPTSPSDPHTPPA